MLLTVTVNSAIFPHEVVVYNFILVAAGLPGEKRGVGSSVT